jgi:replication factor A1
MKENESVISQLSKVADLRKDSRSVETIIKVVSKSEKRVVFLRSDRKKHLVSYALVGDETGCIHLTLWDDVIDKIKVGQVLRITNGYVSLFEGSMRLNIGRYGGFKIIDSAPFDGVNLEKNLSNRVIE